MNEGMIDSIQELVGTLEEGILKEVLLQEYPTLDKYNGIHVSGAKVQKTVPTGGYHTWHDEHSTCPSSVKTILAWGLFLNTLYFTFCKRTEALAILTDALANSSKQSVNRWPTNLSNASHLRSLYIYAK